MRIANEAIGRCRLDRVLAPAANPPHKSTLRHAPYQDRVRMAEIACQGLAQVEVSRLEEGTEWSYSIHTIEKVRAPDARRRSFLRDRRRRLRWHPHLASLAGCRSRGMFPGGEPAGRRLRRAARGADGAHRPAGTGHLVVGNSPATGGRRAAAGGACPGNGLHPRPPLGARRRRDQILGGPSATGSCLNPCWMSAATGQDSLA